MGRGKSRKNHYRRSTPVVRLRRNLLKMGAHARLALERLRGWQSSGDGRVRRILARVEEVAGACVLLDKLAARLEEGGFVPPRKPSTYQPEVGEHVRVAERYRGRYRELYERQLREDPTLLDDLVVAKVLPSGEVAVQRGRRTPLAARKSHLFPARRDG